MLYFICTNIVATGFIFDICHLFATFLQTKASSAFSDKTYLLSRLA